MDGNKIIYEEVFYLFIYPPTHPNLFSFTFFHLFYPTLPHTLNVKTKVMLILHQQKKNKRRKTYKNIQPTEKC